LVAHEAPDVGAMLGPEPSLAKRPRLSRLIGEILARALMMVVRMGARRRRRIHVLMPASAGSLGDQAVLCGIAEISQSLGYERPVQVMLANWRSLSCPLAQDRINLPDRIERVSEVLDFAWKFKNCSQFMILGTDVIDGTYSSASVANLVDIVNLAARLGLAPHICAFNFSASPHPRAVERLSTLDARVRCTCRDAISLARFEAAVGRPAYLVTDPAFLMLPRLAAAGAGAASAWLGERRTAGDALIAVNANGLATANVSAALEAYASELSAVLERAPVSLLLLPHDDRGDHSDLPPLRALEVLLAARFPGRICLAQPPLDAWDVKYLAGECDLVVSGRLHLAIAALSQGVPAIGFEYHDKFRGIFAQLGVEELLLAQSDLLIAGRLSALILRAVSTAERLRETLRSTRSYVDAGSASLAHCVEIAPVDRRFRGGRGAAQNIIRAPTVKARGSDGL
jgi:colanic acid/amylovoran biosynthesis protein